jgi:hypothetical protein
LILFIHFLFKADIYDFGNRIRGKNENFSSHSFIHSFIHYQNLRCPMFTLLLFPPVLFLPLLSFSSTGYYRSGRGGERMGVAAIHEHCEEKAVTLNVMIVLEDYCRVAYTGSAVWGGGTLYRTVWCVVS